MNKCIVRNMLNEIGETLLIVGFVGILLAMIVVFARAVVIFLAQLHPLYGPLVGAIAVCAFWCVDGLCCLYQKAKDSCGRQM